MEKQGRRELLEVIEQQKEQLGRYEARLKDVVRAYKGLVKEKETLETSLKVITAAAATDEQGKEGEGDVSDVESTADSQTSTDTANFKSRLGTLSSSLASISQEKAQNEAKYLAERRRLKKEKDELIIQVNNLKAADESLRKNLEDFKSKLIVERHEREQETNNNKLMMKELQKLLADERNLKEKLNDELHGFRTGAISIQTTRSSLVEETRLKEVENELEQMKLKLNKSEEQLRDQNSTKQQLRQLQQELFEVRQQHQEQLRSAELAREAAELRAIELQNQQENRVGNLENRLQELSSSVAEYQRLRESDQTDINRLRMKIDLLSDENSVLARAVSTEPPEIKEKHLKQAEIKQIIENVKTYKKTLSEEGIEQTLLEDLFSLPIHTIWRKQVGDLEGQVQEQENLIKELKKEQRVGAPGMYEDFLTYSAQTRELENIKEYNEVLKARLSESKLELGRLEKELKEKCRSLLELKEENEKEKEIERMENRKQIGILKYELQQQRERSLVLLEEKDAEIQRLVGDLEKTVEDAFFSPERPESSSSLVLPARKVSCDIGDMNAGPNSSGPPLHYVQELSRKEVEIKEMRALQFQTETTLRELQLTMSTKEEKYQEKIEDLEDTISRLERMTTSEGANLEYLKNVVLTYMLSTDISSRNHMLKAIGAVLRLSKSEVSRVMEQNNAWWWQHSHKTPPKTN
ncbi:GRIP and coiled-coil domain-containing protein 1 isoform X1 [Eurytemora carolleeae]|uniref:GRIP and coiled-coil domain-containing protein 1 isoform X1 n=1 Tax=Eurytemora carolleeae TaxID=1294199 RepID=UPI000C77CCBC|nr:GRIP and coiled-coil domain-containing protein 1 isoform X1 [Eurytemora carolleeae]|eukprot:XP_023344180.1 GRIP and coiled-coil domain-containing protein 1-like isoform X1 [Eurytemora affinis]